MQYSSGMTSSYTEGGKSPVPSSPAIDQSEINPEAGLGIAGVQIELRYLSLIE